MFRLSEIGKIKSKASSEIGESVFGIGFEKLDRGLFDPEKCYPFLAETGAKWARLQSGWQRTERTRGMYDFSWLDTVVDRLISVGISPWLCLCYGNDLYTKEAESVFGAVGCPPIKTEDEREAWCRYVDATVRHFKGRIEYYEIWNEPDGAWCWKHGPSASELAELTVLTAKAAKNADPDCKVIGFVTCLKDGVFPEELAAHGVTDVLDAISYHAYSVHEDDFEKVYGIYDAIRKKYKPELMLIQGESGAQSRSDGAGAMSGCMWNEEKQTKFLLRHLLTDMALGVKLTSYFSCMDMAEALNGKVGDVSSYRDFGYFGLLGADFDENGIASGNYCPKPSYYAFRTLCSVFSDGCKPCAVSGIVPTVEYSGLLWDNDYDLASGKCYSFTKPNGSVGITYWRPTDVLTDTFESTVSFTVTDELYDLGMRLVDLRNGSVYSIPENMIRKDANGVTLLNLPVYDSPLLLTAGEFCEIIR